MKQQLADCEDPVTIGGLLHLNYNSNVVQFDCDNNSMCTTIKNSVYSQCNHWQAILTAYTHPWPHSHWLTLDFFSPVTPNEVLGLLNSIPAESSALDCMPTSLFKSHSKKVFSPIIAKLANLLFHKEPFPLKSNMPKLHLFLKNPGLPLSDDSDSGNFAPYLILTIFPSNYNACFSLSLSQLPQTAMSRPGRLANIDECLVTLT